MTLWLGQDGFDHAFQADYGRLWTDEIHGIARSPSTIRIADQHRIQARRAAFLQPSAGSATTFLRSRRSGCRTSAYARLRPCAVRGRTASLRGLVISRYSRMLGLHLNDGYAKRDDGLMVGAVHSVQTIELLRRVRPTASRARCTSTLSQT